MDPPAPSDEDNDMLNVNVILCIRQSNSEPHKTVLPGWQQLQAFKTPVHPTWRCDRAWKKVEDVARRLYGPELRDYYVQRFKDKNWSDFDVRSYTMRLLFKEATHPGDYLIHALLNPIYRENSVAVGSCLVPEFVEKRRLSIPERERVKRRKLQVQQYGAALDEVDEDTPLRSRESDREGDARAGGITIGTEEINQIDADGFKIPRQVKTGRKRDRDEFTEESEYEVLVQDSQATNNDNSVVPDTYSSGRSQRAPTLSNLRSEKRRSRSRSISQISHPGSEASLTANGEIDITAASILDNRPDSQPESSAGPSTKANWRANTADPPFVPQQQIREISNLAVQDQRARSALPAAQKDVVTPAKNEAAPQSTRSASHQNTAERLAKSTKKPHGPITPETAGQRSSKEPPDSAQLPRPSPLSRHIAPPRPDIYELRESARSTRFRKPERAPGTDLEHDTDLEDPIEDPIEDPVEHPIEPPAEHPVEHPTEEDNYDQPGVEDEDMIAAALRASEIHRHGCSSTRSEELEPQGARHGTKSRSQVDHHADYSGVLLSNEDAGEGDVEEPQLPTSDESGLPESSQRALSSQSKRWTADEDNILREAALENLQMKDILKQSNLGRSGAAIRNRWIELKLPTRDSSTSSATPKPRWSETAITVLVGAVKRGLANNEVQEQYFPQRTQESVASKIRKMNPKIWDGVAKLLQDPPGGASLTLPNWGSRHEIQLRRVCEQGIPDDEAWYRFFKQWSFINYCTKKRQMLAKLRKSSLPALEQHAHEACSSQQNDGFTHIDDIAPASNQHHSPHAAAPAAAETPDNGEQPRQRRDALVLPTTSDEAPRGVRRIQLAPPQPRGKLLCAPGFHRNASNVTTLGSITSDRATLDTDTLMIRPAGVVKIRAQPHAAERASTSVSATGGGKKLTRGLRGSSKSMAETASQPACATATPATMKTKHVIKQSMLHFHRDKGKKPLRPFLSAVDSTRSSNSAVPGPSKDIETIEISDDNSNTRSPLPATVANGVTPTSSMEEGLQSARSLTTAALDLGNSGAVTTWSAVNASAVSEKVIPDSIETAIELVTEAATTTQEVVAEGLPKKPNRRTNMKLQSRKRKIEADSDAEDQSVGFQTQDPSTTLSQRQEASRQVEIAAARVREGAAAIVRQWHLVENFDASGEASIEDSTTQSQADAELEEGQSDGDEIDDIIDWRRRLNEEAAAKLQTQLEEAVKRSEQELASESVIYRGEAEEVFDDDDQPLVESASDAAYASTQTMLEELRSRRKQPAGISMQPETEVAATTLPAKKKRKVTEAELDVRSRSTQTSPTQPPTTGVKVAAIAPPAPDDESLMKHSSRERMEAQSSTIIRSDGQPLSKRAARKYRARQRESLMKATNASTELHTSLQTAITARAHQHLGSTPSRSRPWRQVTPIGETQAPRITHTGTKFIGSTPGGRVYKKTTNAESRINTCSKGTSMHSEESGDDEISKRATKAAKIAKGGDTVTDGPMTKNHSSLQHLKKLTVASPDMRRRATTLKPPPSEDDDGSEEDEEGSSSSSSSSSDGNSKSEEEVRPVKATKGITKRLHGINVIAKRLKRANQMSELKRKERLGTFI